jgi:hypothetical protein
MSTDATPLSFRDRLLAALAHAADKAKSAVPDLTQAYNGIHDFENILHLAASPHITTESRQALANKAAEVLGRVHITTAGLSHTLHVFCKDHDLTPPAPLAGIEQDVARVAKDKLPTAPPEPKAAK